MDAENFKEYREVLEGLVTAEKLVSLVEEHNTNCFNLIKTFRKVRFDETLGDKLKKYL